MGAVALVYLNTLSDLAAPTPKIHGRAEVNDWKLGTVEMEGGQSSVEMKATGVTQSGSQRGRETGGQTRVWWRVQMMQFDLPLLCN